MTGNNRVSVVRPNPFRKTKSRRPRKLYWNLSVTSVRERECKPLRDARHSLSVARRRTKLAHPTKHNLESNILANSQPYYMLSLCEQFTCLENYAPICTNSRPAHIDMMLLSWLVWDARILLVLWLISSQFELATGLEPPVVNFDGCRATSINEASDYQTFDSTNALNPSPC